MKNVMRNIITLAFIGIISGCTLTTYTPPKGAKTTNVTFINEGESWADLQFFLSSQCTGRRLIKNNANGLSGLRAKESQTYLFEQDKPFTFEAGYHLGTTQNSNGIQVKVCRLMYNITPQQDDVLIRLKRHSDSCSADVFEVANGKVMNAQENLKLTEKHHKVSMSNDGPWCE